MSYCVDDTIAALASPPGGAVRGVIRLSGPGTVACLQSCFRPHGPRDLEQVTIAAVIPGSLTLEPPTNRLPCALYLWPTTRSYTRQVSAELHTLGSPPLLDAALRVLCHGGARLAGPGEFTLRAFLAGRLDLTQAEAVLGVVDAEDSRSLDVALAQLAGGLTGPLGTLRSDLLDLLADLEAGLDFVDEDIAFVTGADAAARLLAARQLVDDVLRRITARGTSTREPRVVLRGWPNVGKSSLTNALAEGDVAIVSELAGTTRDYVSRSFCWDGVQGVLVDTAGAEHPGSHDTLAMQAQQLAQDQLEQAELELFCLDATRPLNPWERAALQHSHDVNRLVVWTKTDASTVRIELNTPAVRTSSHTGEGIEPLRRRIRELLAAKRASTALVVASTAQRCQLSLEAAAEHIDLARQLITHEQGHELVALELREVLEHLGQVVGAVYTDDILDRVFQRFCIGK